MPIPTNEYRVHGDQDASYGEPTSTNMLDALEAELSDIDGVQYVWQDDVLIEVECESGSGAVDDVIDCVADWPVCVVTQNESFVSVRAE